MPAPQHKKHPEKATNSIAKHLPLGLRVHNEEQSDVIKAIVQEIASAIGVILKNKQQKHAFYNLCLAFWYRDFATLIISLNRNIYESSPYNTNDISYSAFRRVVNSLGARNIGALDIKKGGKLTSGIRTTITPIGRYAQLLEQHKAIKAHIQNRRAAIELRTFRGKYQEKGIMIPYKMKPSIKKLWKEVESVNDFLAEANIGFTPKAIPQAVIDIIADRQGKLDRIYSANAQYRNLHRIFSAEYRHPNLKHHGRLYGGFFQQLPKEARSYITINDNPVIRLDFTGQHAHMLYVFKTGRYYHKPDAANKPFDPHAHVYDATAGKYLPRSLAKMVFNTMINCKNFQEARGAIANHQDLDKPDMKGVAYLKGDEAETRRLIHLVRNHHKPIRHLFFNPLLPENKYAHAFTLMYWDSQIAMDILKRGVKDKRVILPVHDEFIMESQYEDYLYESMGKSYINIMSKYSGLNISVLDIKNIISVQ